MRVKPRTLLGVLLGLGLVPAPARADRVSVVENGKIRVGIDLDRGGSITLVATAGGENLINSHDLGRQIQPSFYSGPKPLGDAHPGWKGWPWNPIGSGDVYGNPSKVLENRNDGRTLYVKTLPMQWALKNVPGECTFETWIALEDRVAHVRTRLNNHRPDKIQYRARDQELSAVYTIGKLHRLVSYDGTRPFTSAPVRELKNAGPPWTSWKATENWAALLDDHGWGLGVFHAGVYPFIGGFHGTPNQGGPHDDPTGYIAPVLKEILDADIVYEYQYDLIVGTLEEIRAHAVARRVLDPRPDYRFARDRRHWIYVNASDDGYPIRGALRVRLDRTDPHLIGPEQWWEANAVPKLYVRAAYHGKPSRAGVFWSVAGENGFSPERRIAFAVNPDGDFHTYEVDLASSPRYRGTITGLRFDPAEGGNPEDRADVAFISWKPE